MERAAGKQCFSYKSFVKFSRRGGGGGGDPSGPSIKSTHGQVERKLAIYMPTRKLAHYLVVGSAACACMYTSQRWFSMSTYATG